MRGGPMQGKRVLVTGGAGFLGSHLVERLSAHNEVSVYDDLSTGSLRNLSGAKEGVRLHRASILQPKPLAKALEGQDLVYHLAAKTSVPESVEEPTEYWRTNVEGTLNVLKAAADAGVKRVVFISSAAVYGSSDVVPKIETMRPEPASPYATTKMVGEFACQEISQLKPLETVVLRLFNGYGPRQDSDAPYAGAIAKFCSAVARGEGIEIYGDGDQTRDFLYAADAAEAIELAGERAVAGRTFNVGSGAATTVNEVARLLSEIAACPVKAVRRAVRPGDVRHSRADIAEAMASLGFAPKTSLREGIERTLRWHQERAETE